MVLAYVEFHPRRNNPRQLTQVWVLSLIWTLYYIHVPSVEVSYTLGGFGFKDTSI